MNTCTHQNLDLLPPPQSKIRCLYCHLTIKKNELINGSCPECLEIKGKRKTDFENVKAEENLTTRYRCEECGIIIEVT